MDEINAPKDDSNIYGPPRSEMMNLCDLYSQNSDFNSRFLGFPKQLFDQNSRDKLTRKDSTENTLWSSKEVFNLATSPVVNKASLVDNLTYLANNLQNIPSKVLENIEFNYDEQMSSEIMNMYMVSFEGVDISRKIRKITIIGLLQVR